MKTKKAKRKNKYTELRAAIAAVRKVNKGLLRVLPQWPEGWRMVLSSREVQWRLRRHFPDNAFYDRVFHEEYSFFKAITPTARRERSRAYWELLRKIAGYSRRELRLARPLATLLRKALATRANARRILLAPSWINEDAARTLCLGRENRSPRRGAFGTRPRTIIGRGAARCGLKGAA